MTRLFGASGERRPNSSLVRLAGANGHDSVGGLMPLPLWPSLRTPVSAGRSRKRRVGFDQSLLLKLGPEFGRDFRLQRIIVFGDLLMASRPDDEGNRDIRRCRELKRGRAKIHAITSGHLAKFFALFDRGRGDLEVFLPVIVARAPGI
jgi:hypothetical protein